MLFIDGRNKNKDDMVTGKNNSDVGRVIVG
jgi:hypothetical protein